MKKLLVYNVRGEKRTLLKKICGDLDIAFTVVSPAEHGEPVGALAGFPGMKKQGKGCRGAGVPGELLVFAGLDSGALDEFLDACKREALAPTDCKAVLTPHNARWSGEQLYAELVKEHRLTTAE